MAQDQVNRTGQGTVDVASREVSIPPEAPSEFWAWCTFGALLAFLVFSYWNMFREAYFAWQGGLYSHGYLIPFIAAWLFWMRRKPLEPVPTWQCLLGVALLVLSVMLRVYFCAWQVFDMWTFILAFTSLIIIVGGFSMLRWSWGICVLLVFMFPIPWQFEQALLVPLQNLATTVSVFFLQVFGFTAVQEGNTIHLAQTQLGVADQCSGLRMTTILLALSVTLVMVGEKTKTENVLILLSAIPIALVTNITRIVVTGMIMAFSPDNESLHKFVHDAAGICMVPLALGLLIFVQWVVSHLFIEDDEEEQTTSAMESPGSVFWDNKRKVID